ncbi:MAG: hypothetical protein JM58_09640 [Peptococcaceae bacterium BICA1-8]|nr:MAG: hypothetical protein JM58_09640 [Peptococcaceae bacterium BICA1-8]
MFKIKIRNRKALVKEELRKHGIIDAIFLHRKLYGSGLKEARDAVRSYQKQTKIRFGFKSKNQTPLFMVWKEYWENDKLTFAEVLFEI